MHSRVLVPAPVRPRRLGPQATSGRLRRKILKEDQTRSLMFSTFPFGAATRPMSSSRFSFSCRVPLCGSVHSRVHVPAPVRYRRLGPQAASGRLRLPLPDIHTPTCALVQSVRFMAYTARTVPHTCHCAGWLKAPFTGSHGQRASSKARPACLSRAYTVLVLRPAGGSLPARPETQEGAQQNRAPLPRVGPRRRQGRAMRMRAA